MLSLMAKLSGAYVPKAQQTPDRMRAKLLKQTIALMETPRAVELMKIRSLHQAELAIQSALEDAIEGSRAAGDSWATIGAALGTSAQGAQQRYNRSKAARSADTD